MPLTAFTRAERYKWFGPDAAIELARQLAYVGPENARIEIHDQGEDAWIQVVDTTGRVGADDCPPINHSHICPPDC